MRTKKKKSEGNKFKILLKLITKPQLSGQPTTFKFQSRDMWLSHPGICYTKYYC